MLLFRLTDVHLAYGPQVLFEKVSLSIQSGDRIGLLGRNGAGKSTFLKLLGAEVRVDDGEFWQQPGLKVAYLNQELPPANQKTVADYVLEGLSEAGKLIREFHQLSAAEPTEQNLASLADLKKKIEIAGAWNLQQKVESSLSKLDISGDALMSSLSGAG